MTLPKIIETFPIPNAAPLHGRLYVRTVEYLRGPFDVGVLKAMQLRGEIVRDTMLSPDRVRWVTAGSLPQLFPAELFASCIPSSERDMLWHVLIEGQRQGPISWNSLCDLAESGRLRAMDLVTVDGGDNWVRASAVAGLPVPADSGPGVFSESKKAWMIGAGMATTILAVVPLVLMLIWNEFGITRSQNIFDTYKNNEFQSTQLESQLNSQEEQLTRTLASQERIAQLQKEAQIRRGELEALAQQLKIEGEIMQHEQDIAKKDQMMRQQVESNRQLQRIQEELWLLRNP